MSVRLTPFYCNRTLPIGVMVRRDEWDPKVPKTAAHRPARAASLQVREVLGDEVHVHKAAVGVGQAAGDGARRGIADCHAVDLGHGTDA